MARRMEAGEAAEREPQALGPATSTCAPQAARVSFADDGEEAREQPLALAGAVENILVLPGDGIAANHGTTFGTGGENFLRFNLGTQRARIQEACARLAEAFSDLQ